MKAIIKYVADDGSEHLTTEACLKRDDLCTAIRGILAALPPRPNNDSCRFENGGGYIQHDAHTFEAFKSALLDLTAPFVAGELGDEWVEDTRRGKRHPSWLARLVSDTSIRPLYDAWHRILCTDDLLREWGQGYYAANPQRANGQFCINPKSETEAVA